MLPKVNSEKLRRVVDVIQCVPLSGIACRVAALGMVEEA